MVWKDLRSDLHVDELTQMEINDRFERRRAPRAGCCPTPRAAYRHRHALARRADSRRNQLQALIAALDGLDTCALPAGLPSGFIDLHKQAVARFRVAVTRRPVREGELPRRIATGMPSHQKSGGPVAGCRWRFMALARSPLHECRAESLPARQRPGQWRNARRRKPSSSSAQRAGQACSAVARRGRPQPPRQ